MSGPDSLIGRRHRLVTFALVGAIGIVLSTAAAPAETRYLLRQPAANADDTSIRPFHIHMSDEALADLRRRIAATKWPKQETVTGCIARRAARDGAETRTLLADRLRLAQGRGEAERLTAIHDNHRRTGHSFHSHSFKT